MAEKYSIGMENTLKGRLFNAFLDTIVAGLIRFVWIKSVKGLENLPKAGPYIIAANHQSYLDFFCLQSNLPVKMTFLAAEKFFDAPFWGTLMRYTGQIRVDRNADDKSEAINKGLQALKHGKVLALFPQGTRSRSGKIEKTFTGVARFALNAKVPVVPIGIKGAYEVFPPHKNRPKLKKIIEISVGRPIDLSQYYNREESRELYREVTNEIMVEVSKLSGKEYIPEQ